MKIYTRITAIVLVLLCLLSLTACDFGNEDEITSLPTVGTQANTSSWQTKRLGKLSISFPKELKASYPEELSASKTSPEDFFIDLDGKMENHIICQANFDKPGSFSDTFSESTAAELGEQMLTLNPAYKEMLSSEFVNLDGEKALLMNILMDNAGEDYLAQSLLLTYDGYDYTLVTMVRKAEQEKYLELRDQILGTIRFEP